MHKHTISHPYYPGKKSFTCYVVFFTCILLSALYGCTKNFSFTGLNSSPSMVVSCGFDNLHIFHVYVTETATLTGNNQLKPLSNERVELYQNDSLYAVLPYVAADTVNTFGSYVSTFFPVTGKKYGLKIYDPVYGLVTTADSILAVVQVQQFSLDSISGSAATGRVYFTIQFQDNGNTKDYYRLKTWIQGTQWVFNSPTDSILQNYAAGSPPETLTALSDTVRDVDLLFTDGNFNGMDKTIKFWFAIPDTAHFQHVNITVELDHESYAQYEYQATLAIARAQGANSTAAVYSNINNGYGIFMSSAISPVTIPVK